MGFQYIWCMQSFSIIIVTWNALHHLKTFLPSVYATKYEHFEIILADNASSDGSAQWVQNHFPKVRIIPLDQNYGYCGGNNRAAAYATFDNLIFLNNDVEVSPNWLDAQAKLLESHPEIGVIQPKIRSWEDRDKFEYAGAAGGFIDINGFPFCRGRLFDHIESDNGQYDTDTPIFWASGAALTIRKSLFEQLGGFYEPFEFHMEEIDLCWRAQLHGHQVWYCHNSIVYHLGGGSLPADSPRKTYYNFRNNLIMLGRNLPKKRRIPRLFLRLCLDGLAGVHFLLKGNFKHIPAIIRAHFSFYAHLRLIHKYRTVNRVDQLSMKISPVGLYTGSVVWDFYIAGNKTFPKLIGWHK